MIPQRIELKGFLCYQDGQEVRFDGAATLWMLSGLNGSGKSSIFDAVTYALFGHHRGGGQHAHELINKDSEALLVEFDFLLDGSPTGPSGRCAATPAAARLARSRSCGAKAATTATANGRRSRGRVRSASSTPGWRTTSA